MTGTPRGGGCRRGARRTEPRSRTAGCAAAGRRPSARAASRRRPGGTRREAPCGRSRGSRTCRHAGVRAPRSGPPAGDGSRGERRHVASARSPIPRPRPVVLHGFLEPVKKGCAIDSGRSPRVPGSEHSVSPRRAASCRESKEAGVSRIVVMNHVTLDGVMQGPGRPDEDTRGGFTKGGWGQRSAAPDDAAGKAMGERMAAGGGLAGWLFGRQTYEGLLSYWNAQGGPFMDGLNNSPKYVASTTLEDPLPWPNSTLLRGDVPEAVRALKAQPGGVLAIMGSGELIRSLMAADLIDEYLLMIHPLVLGTGRRLFPDGVQVALRLIESATTTSTGIVIATYEPAQRTLGEG